MNLESAIKHCEEVMIENLEKTKDRNASDPIAINCFECADEHRQLAEWLKELKQLREQTTWTPVSVGLPKKEMNCLVTDSLGKVHKVTFYHALDGRESYFSGCYCVRAWMPLPESYKGE